MVLTPTWLPCHVVANQEFEGGVGNSLLFSISVTTYFYSITFLHSYLNIV